MQSSPDRNKKIILLLGDAILIVLSIYLSVSIRILESMNVLDVYTGASTFIASTYLLTFYVFDLYNLRHRFKSTAYLARFLLAVTAGTGLTAMVFYLLPHWKFGRGILALNMLFVSGLCYVWRLSFRDLFLATGKRKVIAIVGTGQKGRAIYEALREMNFDVKGFLDDDPTRLDERIGSHSVIGDSRMLVEMSQKREIDAVVVAANHDRRPALLKSIIRAKMNGVEVYGMTSLFEELTGKLPVLHLSDGWLAYTPFHGIRKSAYTTNLKRFIDVALSIAGLLFSLPITLLAVAAIKMDSRGPVLYRQKRVGFNEKVYELLKFRSMTQDAEASGAVWAQQNDPRISRVGRIMRKTRIDEIPQMWNVLKGDMSFVGPRPERPEFVSELGKEIPYYHFRHAVKPGITGWAQVNYRYGASKEDALEKLQYDLYYIKNFSLFLDLHIILRTIRVVLFGMGAR